MDIFEQNEKVHIVGIIKSGGSYIESGSGYGSIRDWDGLNLGSTVGTVFWNLWTGYGLVGH